MNRREFLQGFLRWGVALSLLSFAGYIFFKSQKEEACETFSACEKCSSVESCSKDQAIEFRGDEARK